VSQGRSGRTKRRLLEHLGEQPASLLEANDFRLLVKDKWRWCRSSPQRVDFVEIMFADVKGFVPASLSSASMSLLAGVFVKGIPHPMGARFAGVDGLSADSVSSSHFQLTAKAGRLLGVLQKPEYWYVDPFGWLSKPVAASVTKALKSQIFPWFQNFGQLRKVFEDTKQRFEANRQRNVVIGVQSPSLVLGFLAAQLGEKEDAKKYLRSARLMRNPAYEIDKSRPELLYGNISEEIDAAMERAGQSER